jgi:hypothetical protein
MSPGFHLMDEIFKIMHMSRVINIHNDSHFFLRIVQESTVQIMI